MRFGAIPVGEAEGAILAHSLRVGSGRLRKGVVLDAGAVATLCAEGVETVVVARLDPGDVSEDAAAARLAAALLPVGSNVRVTKAATGRVNLHAETAGLLVYDADQIHAVNAMHPMVTLALLPPFAAVQPRSLVGTVKIISYGVPGEAVDAAASAGAGAVLVAPPALRSAVLVETEVPGLALPRTGARAVAGRLDALRVTLSDTVRVPHDMEPIARALTAAEADLILILTASATSDERDVAPEAVRRAGGEVTRFGMPVDPGNLLFLGRLRGRPVIGLPGCARSPALNGADWVLQRIVCGLSVSDADIARMGVGGLLKESPARGRPREAS